MTQIQEFTLAFVPKLIGVGIALPSACAASSCLQMSSAMPTPISFGTKAEGELLDLGHRLEQGELLKPMTREVTMMVALKLSAPILVTSLVIGFTVSLFQSMTQIQEFTLAFVPKLIGVGIALLICGNWMLHTLMTFTIDLFEGLPAMLG